VKALAELGAFVEFSFFFVSHATQAGLTHVDAETHTVPPVPLPVMVELIRAATPERAIVNSDAGVFLLPPPVEALREFLLLLESAGLSEGDLRTMSATNPARLFGLAVRHVADQRIAASATSRSSAV
jgi:predicted metal-dependent TIM-barrel fold hydrolase